MERRTVLVALAGALSAGCTSGLGLGGDSGGSGDGGHGGSERLEATGDLEVVVDGEPFDLSQDRFQAEHNTEHSLEFHLHDGDDRWWMEGTERVTFGEAIDLLPHFGYERTEDAHVITVDDETYDERDGATVTFRANDERVDPTEYELHDDDDLVVDVETA